MGQQRNKGHVIGHDARSILTNDGRFHPIMEDLGAGPAHRAEGRDIAAHHRFHRLVRAEPPPQPAAVSQHHAEQPDLAQHTWLCSERDLEQGKVHLRLLTRHRLETPLKLPRDRGQDPPEIFRQRRISPFLPHRPNLTMKPARREPRKGLKPVCKISAEPFGQPLPRVAQAAAWNLETLSEIFLHRFAVQPGLSCNRTDAKPLTFQFKDHHDLPQSNHLQALPLASTGVILREGASGGNARPTLPRAKLGKIHPAGH